MAKNASRLASELIVRKGDAAPSVASAPIATEVASEEKQKPIAVTVRLDPERYERLKMHGVRTRQSNQDILVAALDRYLGQKV